MSFRKRDLQAGSGSNGCDSDSNSSRDSGGGGRSSNDGFMGQGRSSKARQRSPLPFTTKDKEAEVEAKEATDQMGSVCPAFALAAADPSMSSDEETGDLPMAMPANFSVASQKRGGLAGRSFSEADPKTSNMGLPSASYSVASQKRGGFAGRTFSMIGGSSYSIGTNRSSNTRKPPKRKPSPFMVIPDAPHVIAAREALKPNASNSVGELGPRPREGSVFDLGIATSLASIESEARPARGTVVDEIKVENGEVSDMPVATISPTEEGSWTLKRICIEAATMPLLMMISLFTYCPFCIAVVVQSTVQGHAVNTDNWKEEVHGWSWLIGLTVFGGLLIYPIRVAGWLGSIENASGDGMSLKVGGVLAAFLCILVAVQILTAQYAFLKPGLGIVTFPANKSLDLLHWRNILPLVSPLFDFVQFTSLAWRTRPSDSWVCASPQLGRLMHILIRVFTFRFAAITCASIMADESSAAAMKETLGGLNATVGIDEMLLSTNPAEVNFAGAGVAFGFCTIYALLLGYAIAKLLQPGHWLCGIVFEIFAGLGYMPIVSRLLALLSCRPYTLSDGKKILYLADSDNSLVRTQCFTGGHKKWGGMALAGLLLFGLSAIFVGSYKADKHVRRSAVTFIPRIVVVRRFMTSFLLFINLVLRYIIEDDVYLSYATQATGIIILSGLIFIDVYYNSCTFDEIRILALGSHLAGLWSYIAVLLVTTKRVRDDTGALMMFVGWLAVLCSIGIKMYFVRRKSKADFEALKSYPHGNGAEEGKSVGFSSQTMVFKVVTLRRRIQVAIGAGYEDEDIAIAAALHRERHPEDFQGQDEIEEKFSSAFGEGPPDEVNNILVSAPVDETEASPSWEDDVLTPAETKRVFSSTNLENLDP